MPLGSLSLLQKVAGGETIGLRIGAYRSRHGAMQVAFPDELIQGLDLTPDKVRVDLAVGLYAGRQVTLGRAAKIAGMVQAAFLQKLGELRIPMHYDLPEFEEDLLVVREAE